MPMSAPSPSSKARGFTLIEVLVTLVVIGIIVGVVSISFSRDSDSEARRLATRLKKQMEFAADRAVLQQHTVGLYIDPQMYQFLGYSWQDQRWYPLLLDEMTSMPLPPAWVFRLGEEEDETLALDSDGQAIPQLLFMPSGESTAFELFLEESYSNSPVIRLYSDGFSGVRIDSSEREG